MREDKEIDRTINNMYIELSNLEWELKEKIMELNRQIDNFTKELTANNKFIYTTTEEIKTIHKGMKKDFVETMKLDEELEKEFEELNL